MCAAPLEIKTDIGDRRCLVILFVERSGLDVTGLLDSPDAPPEQNYLTYKIGWLAGRKL